LKKEKMIDLIKVCTWHHIIADQITTYVY